MSCEVPFSYTHAHTHRTNTCTYALLVLYIHKLKGFYQCSGIAAFVSTVQRIQLSPPHPLLSFILHLHPCHSSFPSPRHPLPFFSAFTSISLRPPSFQPLHPHIWNGSDTSYWLRRQNQRNRQPISFRANRVTIIHEAVQLLCRLHPCHVCICNAFPCPCTYTAHFHSTWTSFLGIRFIYKSLSEIEGDILYEWCQVIVFSILL